MDICSTFITDPQAAVLAEPSDGALHDPAIDAQATAMCGPTPGQAGDNPPLSQRMFHIDSDLRPYRNLIYGDLCQNV